MDRSSTSSEISFHGLRIKRKHTRIRKQIASSLPSQLIVFVFAKQPFTGRYLANIFSKILAAHQNIFRKVLESSQKNTRGEVLCQ